MIVVDCTRESATAVKFFITNPFVNKGLIAKFKKILYREGAL